LHSTFLNKSLYQQIEQSQVHFLTVKVPNICIKSWTYLLSEIL